MPGESKEEPHLLPESEQLLGKLCLSCDLEGKEDASGCLERDGF